MKYKKREKVNTVFRGKKTNLREPTILEGDTVYYHGCSFDLSAGGVDQYTHVFFHLDVSGGGKGYVEHCCVIQAEIGLSFKVKRCRCRCKS